MNDPQTDKPVHILLADDDEDDRFLVLEAFRQQFPDSRLTMVEDGEELLEFLERREAYQHTPPDMPDLILLDLNMPRIDGRDVLRQLKQNPSWRHIPVVVLTTSDAQPDVQRSYTDGANSFITKPSNFQGLLNTAQILGQYWFKVVTICQPGGTDLLTR